MVKIEPGSEAWGSMMQQALTEASEKAIAEHIRAGRGDKILAMQETVARYYAGHSKQA